MACHSNSAFEPSADLKARLNPSIPNIAARNLDRLRNEDPSHLFPSLSRTRDYQKRSIYLDNNLTIQHLEQGVAQAQS